MTKVRSVQAIIAGHLEYCEAVRRFADVGDWKRIREHIEQQDLEIANLSAKVKALESQRQ